MMSGNKIGVGIIGTGNIAGPYTKDLLTYPELELVGVADVIPARAEAFAQEHGVHAFPEVSALLADERVQIAVNLTSHFAHKDVTLLALDAGKHVFSEKPLAATYADARQLVETAQQKGLRLGSAPITLMGEAQQTAWKLIRDGRIGDVALAYAEVNWGRIESWHPAPGAFYEIGALFDVGVYPLTILTAMFGPARRVMAYGKVVYPDRVTQAGEPFHITTPDFAVSLVELSGGVTVRLTTNFYVGHRTRQVGIEFHGHGGSVHLESWQHFHSDVYQADFGKPYERVPLVRDPYSGTPWARGVWEMAQAMAEGRPHRFRGEQAAHVVDILCAAAESMKIERPVDVTSTFTPPAPMEWAL